MTLIILSKCRDYTCLLYGARNSPIRLNFIDLTGDYKTAFNKGKQQETEMRVKHLKNMERL